MGDLFSDAASQRAGEVGLRGERVRIEAHQARVHEPGGPHPHGVRHVAGIQGLRVVGDQHLDGPVGRLSPLPSAPPRHQQR